MMRCEFEVQNEELAGSDLVGARDRVEKIGEREREGPAGDRAKEEREAVDRVNSRFF